MGTRLYVGNVSYKVTEEELKELFSKAGEVVSVKLLTDAATGKLRGFGFVEMGSDSDAQKAITMYNKTAFMDRTLVVSEAKPQEKRRPRREFR
ncbi:MAG: RNA-binding protein [Nitrospirae bacterium]|nr:RNA-binding protein [Nitrospirota bacterium]